MKKKFLALLFLLPIAAHASFSDVDVTHPHFQAIDFFEKKEILSGYLQGGKKFFRSSQKVTRAESVKVLLLAADFEISDAQNPFSDVSENSWFYPFVVTAANLAIVRGFADGDFHPSAQVTQAELLKMAMTAFGAKIPDPTGDQTWYDPFFEKAAELQLIDGDPTPYAALDRGEIVELIFRAQQVAENNFTEPFVFRASGAASWYGSDFSGKLTASGEKYDPMSMTAAHRTLPFGTRLKVSSDENFIIVRVNDRGPFVGTRVLDLSEAAFAELAPLERGVIEVSVEQFSGAEQENPEIPEFVRDKVSPVIKNPEIPEIVATKILENRGTIEKISPVHDARIFDESVAHLSPDFFENILLRQSVPQKVLTGTVLNISGNVDTFGHEKVTVFLSGKTDSEQQHFSDKLSGENFVIPVAFLDVGTYKMGIVIDDGTRSRVGEIKVVRPRREKRFSSSDQDFSAFQFGTRIVPEEEMVKFDFQNLSSSNLVKLIFSQDPVREALLIEGNIPTLSLPYDFFEKFSHGDSFSVSVSVADSTDGTLAGQISNWKKLADEKYELVAGFRDTELEKISVHNFSRFLRSTESFILSGKILDQNTKLRSAVFLRTPAGRIREIPVANGEFDLFSFRVTPEEWGTHILEITSDAGEILFNRAIYFSENFVLPVLPWSHEILRGKSSVGVRDWVNKIRKKYGLGVVVTDTNLQALAQQYAEKMALENFLGHTSPTGMKFADRLQQANLQGEFAENLSFGSTLQIALEGIEDSSSHFSHVVNRKWRSLGVGIASGNGGWYVVQIFGY